MEENTNNLRENVEELYKQNKFKEIKALLTDALLEAHKDAVLYAWRGWANFRLDVDVAKNMFFAEKAIAIDPNYFMGFFVRALIHNDREEYIKAINDYTKAIELNLDFADAYYYRGLTWQILDKKDKAFADFDKAIVIYNKAIKNNKEDAELYIRRGNTSYDKRDYKNAIKDYDKAIKNNPNYLLAFYNKAQVRVAQKNYKDAIKNFNKVIDLDPRYAEAYISRGHVKRLFNNDYDGAIEDYSKAIKDDKNAPYYRGLAYYKKALNKKEEANIDLLRKKSKKDFIQYIELTSDDKDIGVRYAKYYLKKLDEINDYALNEIKDLVFKIKEILRIKKGYIAHYTSLSSMKILILSDSCKLRISEGNFMNDPSEGTEFYNFLYSEDKKKEVETTEMETFVPKPFIGSFVTEVMDNDLNMWRFYGKEDGVEAKGCSIVLRMREFIEDIKNSLSNEKNKDARIEDESDINFYWVAYKPHKSTKFNIPSLKFKKNKDFNGMLDELKDNVTSYKKVKGADIASLEEYLNYIAFLFKRDDYKNENEVRLVMTGIEFEKKYCEENKQDKSVNPPRVYIELVPIKKSVKQITLGPKVDKANEWASALYYSYIKEKEIPDILISHLPYK